MNISQRLSKTWNTEFTIIYEKYRTNQKLVLIAGLNKSQATILDLAQHRLRSSRIIDVMCYFNQVIKDSLSFYKITARYIFGRDVLFLENCCDVKLESMKTFNGAVFIVSAYQQQRPELPLRTGKNTIKKILGRPTFRETNPLFSCLVS